MAQSAIDKIPPGPKLDALTAEKVFVCQKVHMHQGSLVGRKQDKAGHWRRAKVPNYSTNPLHSYSVENRVKELGRIDRYERNFPSLPALKTFRPIGPRQSNAVGLRLKRWDYTARSFRWAGVANRDSKIASASLSHSGFVQSFPAAPQSSCPPRLIWMVFVGPTVIA